MMRYVEKPNLPDGQVSKVICGKLPDFLNEYLESRNIEIIECKSNQLIDSAVKSHADMCAVHLGGSIIAVDKSQLQLISKLKSIGFEVVETAEKIAGEYPNDVKLNVALFGNTAVGAFKYCDSNLLKNIQAFNQFNVKQGYTKCSVLPINEKALITDDESVYNSLKNAFNVLLIKKGDVVLTGHEYGFIGGASAKISKDEIIFFGNLEAHRNYRDITSFLTKHNCKAVYFKNQPLTDLGGLIVLTEQ